MGAGGERVSQRKSLRADGRHASLALALRLTGVARREGPAAITGAMGVCHGSMQHCCVSTASGMQVHTTTHDRRPRLAASRYTKGGGRYM